MDCGVYSFQRLLKRALTALKKSFPSPSDFLLLVFSLYTTMLTMLDSSVTRAVVGVTLLAIVVSILDAFRTRYKKGLREIPGPPFAAWSRLWTLHNASTGRAPLNYIALHKKYGQVVRVGPNHVSLADPEMISVIYGTNNKYVKVRTTGIKLTTTDIDRRHSTMYSALS